MHEFPAWVWCGDVEQLHRFYNWRVLVIVGHNEQLWQLRRLPQKVETFGLSRKQDQRFHLGGMETRGFDGIFNADYPCSSNADNIPLYSRLRNQILKCSVKLAGPPLLSCFIRIGIDG